MRRPYSFLGALAVTVAVTAAGLPAAADEPWTYKNPAQPSKNPDDLKDSQYRGWHYEKKWEATWTRLI